LKMGGLSRGHFLRY